MIAITTTYVECGCGRRYTPEEASRLRQLGMLKGEEGEPDLILFNCVCGSTLSMPEPQEVKP